MTGRSPVTALAAVEARRLLTHPALLLLILVPLQLVAAVRPDEDFLVYKLLVGAAFLPLAAA